MITTLDDGTLVIGDHNADVLMGAGHPALAGPRNTVPRDPLWRAAVAPRAVDMPLIPESEWAKRIDDMEAAQSSLSHARLRGNAGQPIPSLDQGQVGYCWAHSSTHAVTLLRAAANLPYVPLSAYSVAATIKRGADEGGWGAQSLDFITSKGVMSQAVWPQGDRNYRHYDTPENWANAALHKVTEGWVDLSADLYDRKLSWQQEITSYLCRVPVVKDENWWGHSICGMKPVNGASLVRRLRDGSGKLLHAASLRLFELAVGLDHPVTGGTGVEIWNSWSDSWGKLGTGVLTGSKAVSDGAVAPRVVTASVN